MDYGYNTEDKTIHIAVAKGIDYRYPAPVGFFVILVVTRLLSEAIKVIDEYEFPNGVTGTTEVITREERYL